MQIQLNGAQLPTAQALADINSTCPYPTILLERGLNSTVRNNTVAFNVTLTFSAPPHVVALLALPVVVYNRCSYPLALVQYFARAAA